MEVWTSDDWVTQNAVRQFQRILWRIGKNLQIIILYNIDKVFGSIPVTELHSQSKCQGSKNDIENSDKYPIATRFIVSSIIKYWV